MEPGTRAVVVDLSRVGAGSSSLQVLAIEGGGCILRHSVEVFVSLDKARETRKAYEAHVVRYLARAKDILESAPES